MIKIFEEAVDYVVNGIEKDTVKQPMFHFTGGMAVRNQLGLWDRSSPLHKHMLERFGLCHADDTGMMITHAADAKKNGQLYDPAADVKRCKDHWRAYGLNPATMEKICEKQGEHADLS